MEYFQQITLSDNTSVQIIDGTGLHFFSALRKAEGDTSLFVKYLMTELVIVNKSPLTISKIDEMPIKDVSYISEVIGLLLSDKYRHGI